LLLNFNFHCNICHDHVEFFMYVTILVLLLNFNFQCMSVPAGK